MTSVLYKHVPCLRIECLCPRVSVCFCVCLYASVCFCVCLYASVCFFVCLYASACFCVCLSVCLYASVFESFRMCDCTVCHGRRRKHCKFCDLILVMEEALHANRTNDSIIKLQEAPQSRRRSLERWRQRRRQRYD